MTRPPDLKELDEQIEKLNQEKEAAVAEQDFEKAAAPARPGRQAQEEEGARSPSEWREKAKEVDGVVDEEVIAEVVSKMTGVPLTQVGEDETKRLLKMEDELHKTVISQDEAIKAIAKAVRKSRGRAEGPEAADRQLHLRRPDRRRQDAARQAARQVHVRRRERPRAARHVRVHGEAQRQSGWSARLRATSATRRAASSPRRSAASRTRVVLLDEIEKAHPDVWNMLLQIMEEGRLTDNVGRTVDFKNTILIMTTNIGAETIIDQGDMTSVVLRRAEAERRGQLRGHEEEAHGRDGEGLPAGVPEPPGRHHRLPQADERGPEADHRHRAGEGGQAAQGEGPQAGRDRRGQGVPDREGVEHRSTGPGRCAGRSSSTWRTRWPRSCSAARSRGPTAWW